MRSLIRVDSPARSVEADQDLELGQSLVADVDPAQRVRQRAGRVGDHAGAICLRGLVLGGGVHVGSAVNSGGLVLPKRR